MKLICRHCRKKLVNRSRGLCWGCYYMDGVRDLYPSTHPKGMRGVGNHNSSGPLPEPTTAPPGTPEKVAVLEERARLKLALWHPLDARYEGDPRPLAVQRVKP